MSDKHEFLYKLFLDFLDLNNCREKYFRNHYNYFGSYNIDEISNPEVYISTAFNWSDTDEGYCYWEDLHINWFNLIKTDYNILYYVYYHKKEIKKLLIRFIKENYLDIANLRNIDLNLIITCSLFNAILSIGHSCINKVNLKKLNNLNRIWNFTLINYYDKAIKNYEL